MLNTDHSYYYQLYGQLGLSVLSWIDVVAHSGIGDIFKQLVSPDKHLWSKTMVPKLNLSYFNHALEFFMLHEPNLVLWHVTLNLCAIKTPSDILVLTFKSLRQILLDLIPGNPY